MSDIGIDPGIGKDTGAHADITVDHQPVTGGAGAAARALGVPAGLADWWDRASEFQVRTVHVVRSADRVRGVALAVHRPTTAYEKVAGLWLDDGEDAAKAADAQEERDAPDVRETRAAAIADLLLASVVGHARSQDAVVVKVELGRGVGDHGTLAAAARRAGFTDAGEPVLGAPYPVGPLDVPRGLVRWLDAPTAPPPVPYYRQTTEFTCGPVAVGMAVAALDGPALLDRGNELTLWREATTLIGCDPFGLAVGAAARGVRPAVLISTSEPILLEQVTAAWDRDTRVFIQQDFRTRALAAGLDVQTRDFTIAEVAAHVGRGGVVALLIDEYPMHVEPCPHWITLHAVRGDVVVVNDPWTDDHLGESWLDAVDLPLRLPALERLARWGDPSYRAALLFTR